MATGTGEWQGSQLSIGSSGAYRYVNIWESTFNQSTGVTTIKLNIGTYVNWGNFGGSVFTSWGTPGEQSFEVYGEGTYDVHTYTFTVAYNGSRRFQEGCGYTSASAGGWVESTLDVTWYPTLPTYTVSYNKNTTDSVSNLPSSQSGKWGATVTLSNNTPTRTGYTFAGWNTKQDGTGTNYAKGGSLTTKANVTLYAKWTLNSWTVSYNANGGSGSVSSQTKYYGQALTLASSGFTKTYYTLDGWATSATGGIAYALGASYTGNAGLSLFAHWRIVAPSAPTSVSASRNSDESATVTWTRGADADTTYARIYVERKTDGGEWEPLGYVAGTATSYADTSIAANHSYSYRVRSYNSTDYSAYGTSGTIYTTPAAPASVTGERTGSGSDVLLTVGNDGTRNATGFEVEYRAADSSTWASATPASSTGTPVETITVSNMGGSFYFRVRNTRSALKSEWAESAIVVTITPPAAPTLVSPSSGAVVSASGQTQAVVLEWMHNPIDGSAQTAAQVRYRRSTVETWTTASVTTAQSKSVTLDEGYSYVWQVRTKGADEDYGEWSSTQSFSLYTPPSASISVSPLDGGGNVKGMPIAYTVSYLDAHGQFASGSIVIKLDGATLYSEALPATVTTIGTASPIVGEITVDEFLPSSGKTYTFEVSVRSSDTLTASASMSMPVEMGEPNHGTLIIENDAETGYTALTVGWDGTTGSVPATYATLYRIVDGERVLLGEDMQQGAGVLDKYAPLNVPYEYEIVTHAESTAVAAVNFENEITTDRWFAYWGSSGIAWGKYGPKGSYTLTRPSKTRVWYVGRALPVSYDGTALSEEHDITLTLIESGRWARAFEQLVRDGGRGVYKSRDGRVFHADFECTFTPDYRADDFGIGTVEVKVTRIDGGVL